MIPTSDLTRAMPEASGWRVDISGRLAGLIAYVVTVVSVASVAVAYLSH